MKTESGFAAWLRGTGWVVPLIALVQFGLHLWTNAHDTIFRDEMYYLVAAQHPAFGYLEFPPFVVLVAGFSRAVLGDSVLAIRLLPAMAGVIIVLLTASMAAALGGARGAQALAALAVAFAPVFLGSSGLLTMDPFDQLWWTLLAWVLVRMLREQQPRRWLLAGAVIGLGLQTKLVIAFYVLALLAGFLISSNRRLLFNRWLLFGGLIALAIISPYLVWQVSNGFPVVEFTANYSSGKTFQATPPQFLLQQILTTNPLALPLWLGGLLFLFFAPAGKPYRAFGWAYVLLFLFFMLQKTKFYWLSPAYPPLFAAGAYGLQRLIEGRPKTAWLQPAYSTLLGLTGLLIVPFSLPILTPEAFMRFNAAFAGGIEVKQENLQASELPQNYADRYGWPEMVAAVNEAYTALTPEEQARSCILTQNYGEAAAMAYYGGTPGLPKAISGHNSYYLWGPQGCTGEVLISVGRPLTDLSDAFDSVTAGPAWSCQYCMPHENGTWIYIARGLKAPIEDAWPSVKAFD
jgi:4-amino-4-deoxy-L-arabinose transferase-like glycosyltransferase